MARKKQEQQQAPQAHEAQEPQEVYIVHRHPDTQQAQAPGNQAAPDPQQQEELQRLMQLPLSEIETLPQEQQEAVWQEMARQIVEIPHFAEGISALEKVVKRATNILPTIQPRLQQLQESISQFAKTISTALEPAENLKRLLAERISEETLEALSTMGTLAPYIKAERDEHPELYDDDTPFSDLIAAAARRAREDGKEIPPLKAEEPEPEQLQFVFDAEERTDNRINEETPAALIEAVKKLPVLKPQSHVMPNNPLINMMQQSGIFNAGALELIVSEKKAKKTITAYTMVDYTPGETEITITDPKMTEYERNVSDAIVSLYVEAEKQHVEPVFTIDTIYRAMPGGGETASPQQKGAITKAVEKFRRTHMTIDATEELRKRNAIGEKETFKVDEYYFQMTRAKRTSRNSVQDVTAYKLTEKPVILKYAELTKQIVSVPAKHLAIRKIGKTGIISTELITMNADRQAITGYMMRRIGIMKHDLNDARDKLKYYEQKRKKHPEMELPEKTLSECKVQSNIIKFDTIFAQVGITTEDRKQLMLYRNFCFEVLDYWKATGFIKGYATQNKGKKITGIAIEL